MPRGQRGANPVGHLGPHPGRHRFAVEQDAAISGEVPLAA